MFLKYLRPQKTAENGKKQRNKEREEERIEGRKKVPVTCCGTADMTKCRGPSAPLAITLVYYPPRYVPLLPISALLLNIDIYCCH
jgi:hypothetical protein